MEKSREGGILDMRKKRKCEEKKRPKDGKQKERRQGVSDVTDQAKMFMNV